MKDNALQNTILQNMYASSLLNVFDDRMRGRETKKCTSCISQVCIRLLSKFVASFASLYSYATCHSRRRKKSDDLAIFITCARHQVTL